MSALVRSVSIITASVVLAASGCSYSTDTAASTSTGPTTAAPTTAAPAAAAPTTTGPAPSSGCKNTDDKTTVAYTTIDGVDANALSLDIYNVPVSCDAPVWMWVHGGGYQIGDKKNQVTDKVALARERGWMFVSINYRLSTGGAGSDGTGDAQFPDHYTDVAAAVAWVHDNIATYGGDPQRLALFGHSAGADIVSNVVVNPTYLAEHDMVPTDLGCFAPLDTAGFDKSSASAAEQDNWTVALGNNATFEADTSATLLVTNDTPLPPVLGVTRGAPRRVAIESAFLDAIDAAGGSATRVDAAALSHNEVNTNIGAAGDTVMTKPVTKFLTDCFEES